VIRFNGVGLRYGSGSEVLQDISFELKPGSFHFLTGPSGAGKSSLLRLLFLSLNPTRGQLELFGTNVASVSAARRAQLRRRIGIVFQDFRLLEHLTTWENVALPLRVVGKRIQDYREDVTDLLQWVGLGDRMHASPSVLSGGEKQRAAIARAVIGKPELLLADEPTGNVDPQMARRLLRLFVELNKLGTSVIIATHDHQLMRQFGAPKLELHGGHVRIVS
jgi:cell division transport system ATP-binding protein